MGEPVTESSALHRLAMVHFDRGRLDLARRKLLAALERLDRPELGVNAEALAVRVRVLITLYNVEAELSGRPYRRELLDQADQIVSGIGAEALAFAIDNARGLRAMRDGDEDEALRHFASAEEHLAEAPVEDACILLLNRGTLRLQQLDLAEARADFERCIALVSAQQSDDSLLNLAFMARHNLGYLEYLAGNIPAALQTMDQAAGMPIDGSRGISYLDKARVLIAAGLIDAADRTLLLAEDEFRRGRLHQELAETELARAECAMLARDLASARKLAGSARTRFKRRGNDRWRRIAELTLLQADLAAGRPASLLVAPALRLEREFTDHGLELQARTAGLIACAALAAADRLPEARERFARVHKIEPTDPITIKLQQRAVGAELALASADRGSARAEIRQGLRELTRHQAQFGSIDLQTSSAIHGRRLVELDLDTAFSSHRPDALFSAVERGRAISRRLTAVTPPVGESAELLAELRHLTEIIRSISDDPTAIEVVGQMRQRTSALYTELSSISWRALGAGRPTPPATMADVRTEIERRNQVLVTFCVFRNTWSAIVLGDGPPRLVELPRADQTPELVRRAQADLNVLAYSSLPTEMRNTVTGSLQHTMQRLDDTLIAPLSLGDRPVVLVPTGALAAFSWNCLPSLRGRSIVVSPTATRWLANALSLTHPVASVTVDVLAGPGLGTAQGEATAVAAAWRTLRPDTRATAYVGAEATRDQLSSALASATVVHVAAHGSHQRQNPLFSSLQLADGPLFAYEIEQDPIAAHVILSACELGQNTLRPGDETLGLTSVLLQRGARCVVAGVAQVGDEIAGQVMASYHRRLAAGSDAASALAAAVVEVDQPFVPFVCFGASWRLGTGQA
ncbi:CHAT domain-containing protein [Microlunatus panaciterrae]|uniref:Tetratricopeptide (TPR) repeat protein n=1 Tax=Microlunatus panaciterrae TaxID=400768 RepID=A0ABS2RKY9_9ACTN|nr:CHAT domain-containing tetratricopeptide repeat protein [Microlunatus panaciterrae]MBM7799680.1 tetratricopeptide (TPR) repeat protein [Microlunatus panaciterrae]